MMKISEKDNLDGFEAKGRIIKILRNYQKFGVK